MEKISPESLVELEKRYRTTAFIVLAQIVVTLILIVTAWFVVTTTETPTSSESLTTLWVALLFVAIGTFIFRRLFFNWERLRNVVLLKGIKGVLSTLQTNAILLGAMAEVIALIGFLIAILSGNSSDMFRAGAIALIVFLINFPRKGLWKKIVSGLESV